MGGRGSTRRNNTGSLITIPEEKRRRGKGTKRKKITIDRPGFPVGTPTPAKPTTEKNTE